MIRIIKNKINKKKINKLLNILYLKGTFRKNYDGINRENEELSALICMNLFYHELGARTEEEFVSEMEYANYYFNSPQNLEKDSYSLKQMRRASTWFSQSKSFRERILDFYLDYLLPFSYKKSFFEIYALHKKYKK